MRRIRLVEEALANRYSEQEMRCPIHLCIGQEAIAVGVCESLKTTDRVFSNHRAHGHYLAKGGNLPAMVAEIYGRSTGCCGGRGGSMHLIDLSVGFMGSTPIVGGTIPLAVGSAWASVLQQRSEVTVLFFGDGAFEEGVIHESLNFAKLHQLPIVFVCENNQFSVYTRINERQPDRPIHQIAAAHGLRAKSGDGNCIESVTEMARHAVDEARAGHGPQFLEFSVYRWREHCGPDFDSHLNYRTAQESQQGMAACPIEKCSQILLSQGIIHRADLSAIDTQIQIEIAQAFDFALASDKPTLAQAQEHVYAS
jgi:pyruvate dehydrogenase E1 component alpha subunit